MPQLEEQPSGCFWSYSSKHESTDASQHLPTNFFEAFSQTLHVPPYFSQIHLVLWLSSKLLTPDAPLTLVLNFPLLESHSRGLDTLSSPACLMERGACNNYKFYGNSEVWTTIIVYRLLFFSTIEIVFAFFTMSKKEFQYIWHRFCRNRWGGIHDEEPGDMLNYLSCIYFSCNQRVVPEELGSMNPVLCLVY